jgi:hypothetical protein
LRVCIDCHVPYSSTARRELFAAWRASRGQRAGGAGVDLAYGL